MLSGTTQSYHNQAFRFSQPRSAKTFSGDVLSITTIDTNLDVKSLPKTELEIFTVSEHTGSHYPDENNYC